MGKKTQKKAKPVRAWATKTLRGRLTPWAYRDKTDAEHFARKGGDGVVRVEIRETP